MSVKRVCMVAIGALSALSASAGAARADCDYVITGALAVEHRIPELATAFGQSPVGNVRVRVQGRQKFITGWGPWGTWSGQHRTDEDGGFRISKTKNCAKRRLRVQIKFEDDDLQVRHENSTSSLNKVKWYTVL